MSKTHVEDSIWEINVPNAEFETRLLLTMGRLHWSDVGGALIFQDRPFRFTLQVGEAVPESYSREYIRIRNIW